MAKNINYSNVPLWKKLDIKENMRVLIKSISKYDHVKYIYDYPGMIKIINEYEKNIDFIHLFTDEYEKMEIELKNIIENINKNGIIWISWPKKISKAKTNITENKIRELILPLGLVDIKVCSVSDNFWSGLKIVWRKENR